jgi:hypothetical protein
VALAEALLEARTLPLAESEGEMLRDAEEDGVAVALPEADSDSD